MRYLDWWHPRLKEKEELEPFQIVRDWHTLCLLEFIAFRCKTCWGRCSSKLKTTTFHHGATLGSLQNVFQDQVGKNATSERQEVFIEKETPCIFNKWLKKTIRNQNKRDDELCMWSKRQYHHCEEKEGLNESSRNNATWNKSTFKIHHCGDGLWYTAGWFQLRLLPKVTSTLNQKAEFHSWLSTFTFRRSRELVALCIRFSLCFHHVSSSC